MNYEQYTKKAKEIIELPDSKRVETLLSIEDDRDFVLTTRHCLLLDSDGEFRRDRKLISRAGAVRNVYGPEKRRGLLSGFLSLIGVWEDSPLAQWLKEDDINRKAKSDLHPKDTEAKNEDK